MKEYITENFETEFEKAETITGLQELLKRMKMQRIKWIAAGSENLKQDTIGLLDEQMGLVEWELNKLRRAQSRGRFRVYYAFIKMLDEHYPYKTPLIGYKYILDDGVSNFRKEILSNLLHLPPDGRKRYLVRIQDEMEELLNMNVYASDSVAEEWCQKFDTSERDIFSTEASKHRNDVYRLLSAAGGDAAEVEPVEAYEIQNDFYNVYYGRAIRRVLKLVKEQMEEYQSEAAVAELIEGHEKKKEGSSAGGGQKVRREYMAGSAEDLFFTMEYFESCFQLLKGLQPRVIDDSNNFCLGPRSKGVIVAWVDAMKNKNKIRENSSDHAIAAFLNNKIKGLNITDRTLRSAQTKVSKNYKAFYEQF